ncbi:MAG: hypothetical protein R2939_08800 [Kofleriaceae bacterium]
MATVCRDVVPAAPARDVPRGAGSFVNVVTLGDGRLAIVYYDRVRTALVAQVESSAGASSFAEVVLDDAGDRGMWASAVADGNTLHVAYQDALGDQLLYATWSGGDVTVEVVDDGVRDGDRPHPVGASAALWLDGGAPRVAYQDGMSADVVVATRGAGAGWPRQYVTSDVDLDGFYLAAAGGVLAWDQLSHARYPASALVVQLAP